MRVLFVTRPHLPHRGGGQLTLDALARALTQRGHDVTVLAQGTDPGPPLPYRVVADPDPPGALARVAGEAVADVVVVEARGRNHRDWTARALAAGPAHPPGGGRKGRKVLHVQALGSEDMSSEADAVVAVSEHLARSLPPGVEAAVIAPAIAPECARPPRERRVALMVNPRESKGLETVLALARSRPDVAFALTRAWVPRPEVLDGLEKRIAELPNVQLRPTTDDLYADARLVLVPTREREGFGRVAAEARMAGLPVIATRIGGLPEAAGPLALLLDPAAGPIEWERAFTSVWDDPAEYERRAVPEPRPELAPAAVAERWETVLLSRPAAPGTLVPRPPRRRAR